MERGIEPFDVEKLPKDIKLRARREWHWFLWTRQKKYREIEEITGYERSCIADDIKWVMENLATTPQDMESVRQMALMSLRFLCAEITAEARNASGHVKAGLYKTAAGIYQSILTRYTQPGGKEIAVVQSDAEDKIQGLIDYMIEKMGAEAMLDFEAWWVIRVKAKKQMPKG